MKPRPFALGAALFLIPSAAFVWAQNTEAKPAQAQDPGHAEAPEKNQPALTSITGGSIIIAVSPKNNAVWGYSKHTGMWRKQPVEHPPKDPIQPAVSTECATFQVDKVLYAFSGEKGRWASVSLKGEGEPNIAHYGDMITVQHGVSLSVFSAKTASWDTITFEGE